MVNIIRRLLRTPRHHACSIHRNTQYQILAPTCKHLSWLWVSLATEHHTKCPAKCTKCTFLGKLVYQNMLFKCLHAPCGIISMDSRISEVNFLWSVCQKWGPRKTLSEWICTLFISSIAVTHVFTSQLSCPVNFHWQTEGSLSKGQQYISMGFCQIHTVTHFKKSLYWFFKTNRLSHLGLLHNYHLILRFWHMKNKNDTLK